MFLSLICSVSHGYTILWLLLLPVLMLLLYCFCVIVAAAKTSTKLDTEDGWRCCCLY